MKITTQILVTLKLFTAVLVVPQVASAHCQVPCGIFDDHARVHAMLEDAVTIAKACKLMGELEGKSDAQSKQQFIRWTNEKEAHAQKIIKTTADYFLAQRVKTSMDDYNDRLLAHHAVMVAAMKAKQNADLKYAEALSKAIEAAGVYYPGNH